MLKPSPEVAGFSLTFQPFAVSQPIFKIDAVDFLRVNAKYLQRCTTHFYRAFEHFPLRKSQVQAIVPSGECGRMRTNGGLRECLQHAFERRDPALPVVAEQDRLGRFRTCWRQVNSHAAQ